MVLPGVLPVAGRASGAKKSQLGTVVLQGEVLLQVHVQVLPGVLPAAEQVLKVVQVLLQVRPGVLLGDGGLVQLVGQEILPLVLVWPAPAVLPAAVQLAVLPVVLAAVLPVAVEVQGQGQVLPAAAAVAVVVAPLGPPANGSTTLVGLQGAGCAAAECVACTAACPAVPPSSAKHNTQL